MGTLQNSKLKASEEIPEEHVDTDLLVASGAMQLKGKLQTSPKNSNCPTPKGALAARGALASQQGPFGTTRSYSGLIAMSQGLQGVGNCLRLGWAFLRMLLALLPASGIFVEPKDSQGLKRTRQAALA